MPNKVQRGRREESKGEGKPSFIPHTVKPQHLSLRVKVLATLKVPRAAVAAATAVVVVGGVLAAVSIATEHMRDGVTRAFRRGTHHGGGFSCWHTRAVGWAVSAAFTFFPKIKGYGGW